jgi:sugar phosphate isomerase/epimerase
MTMKGPAIFLAQFAGDEAPFNSLDAITRWAGSLGYKGVQIPTWDARLFDLEKAAESQDYVDEVKGVCAANGVEVTELSTHLQGQLVASHPAYDKLFDGFAPPQFHGNVEARTAWATEQLHLAARASRRFGCASHATFSGALMWHRSGRQGWSRKASPNSPGGGSRSSTPLTRMGSTPASSCTRARTCTTG